MLKYVNTAVTFAEFPDEISLLINISGCPCHCESCHSAYLAEDIGEPLDYTAITKLIIDSNKGITCVGLMGGDSDPEWINKLAEFIKTSSKLKVGWYSGRNYLPSEIDITFFNYIKLGPYIKECGGLQSPNTNQHLYQIEKIDNKYIDGIYGIKEIKLYANSNT